MLKIIHTMPDMNQEAAGPSYSVKRLCESQIELGVDAKIALIGENDFDKYIRAFPPGFGPSKLGRSPQLHNWLKKCVSGKLVDVIHNHSLWMMPNVYPGWATKSSTIPYIVSPRGTLAPWAIESGSVVKRFFWPLIQKPSLEHAQCFHATADSEYEDIRALGFRQPIAIIPNGIDRQRESSARSPRKDTLLYLGRIHKKKGIDILLRSWGIVQSEFPNWNLKIVGPLDSQDAKSLRALSNSLNLVNVNFTGPLYGDDKFRAYRTASLFVLPTHSDNFAISVAESLAAGTPAIVSHGAPWSGLIENDAGWWIPNGVDSLANQLRESMRLTPRKLECMGENGKNWMIRDFDWKVIGQDMLDVYHWLAGRGEKPKCVNTD